MIERPLSEWVKRSERKPMSITGAAYRPDGSWLRVHMTNLAYDGCRLLSAEPLDIGEVLTLVMPRMQHMSVQVRWAKDVEAGVRFLHSASTSSADHRRARIGV